MNAQPTSDPDRPLGDARQAAPARWEAVYLAACSAGASLIAAWLALFTWAFSTMVDPALEGQERIEAIVHRLFFQEGPGPGALLIAMTWAMATCLVATATFLFVAIARFPSLGTSVLISCALGTILAVAVFALLIANG